MIRSINLLEEEDFVLTFDSIIIGALNACYVSPTYAYYEDCYQIGLIKLFEAYGEFPEAIDTEERIYQFGGYAFVRIKWAITDYCRKIMKQTSSEEKLPEDYELTQSTKRFEEDLLTEVDLERFMHYLNSDEVAYLKAFLKEPNVSKIAKELKVSRKTIYDIRKRIAKKYELMNFKEE